MKNGLFKKSLAVGLMVLFIVGGLTSNIGADDIRPTNTGKTWYVDGVATYPGDGTVQYPFKYIWQGIENATYDDTISIASGEYRENIVIDKKLELNWWDEGDIIGNDAEKPIINGSNTGCVIEIKVSDVEINKMNITNSGNTGRDAGIYIEENTKIVNIIECVISDCNIGIWVHRDTNAGIVTTHVIRGNTIYDIQQQGILISFSDGNTISDNEITYCDGHGIHLLDCEGNTIIGNTLKHNLNGIFIDVGRENTISGNTCQNNTRFGFVIVSDIKSRVEENNFMGNGIYQAYWIHYNFYQTTIWTGNYWGRPAALINFIPGEVRKRISIPFAWFEAFPAFSPN